MIVTESETTQKTGQRHPINNPLAEALA